MSIASENNRCLASNMISTGDAASMMGVCKKTLYRWEQSGKLSPAFRTAGNHRRYDRRVILVLIRQKDGDDESSDVVEVSRNET
jgi:excisionase family DNA binding protein